MYAAHHSTGETEQKFGFICSLYHVCLNHKASQHILAHAGSVYTPGPQAGMWTKLTEVCKGKITVHSIYLQALVASRHSRHQ